MMILFFVELQEYIDASEHHLEDKSISDQQHDALCCYTSERSTTLDGIKAHSIGREDDTAVQ